MGETFQSLRKSAGFSTQDSFAEALGVKSRSVVAKWETGESYPRTPLIPKIAQLLNTTAEKVIESIEASKEAHSQSA